MRLAFSAIRNAKSSAIMIQMKNNGKFKRMRLILILLCIRPSDITPYLITIRIVFLAINLPE